MHTQTLGGHLTFNASLAPYTSWKVGGPADLLYVPANLTDLILFLQQLPLETPLLWLGLGSNVLIREGGVEGAVIITQGALTQIELLETGVVRAEAGVACAQISRYTARLGLTGIEFMAGIPGTIGGALAMNAGCWGGETWQWVKEVETVDRAGNVRTRPLCDYEIGYRHVGRPANEWFIAAHFQLSPGEKSHSLETIRVLLDKRSASQPTSWPNCGSVFRNPPGDHAARLIEQCGLKGLAVGGAEVSDKHANFIINTGTATAEDIETLIHRVQSIVAEQQGVQLIPEVCMIGRSQVG